MAFGSRAWRIAAAAVVTKPSTMTGTRSILAAITAPTIAAISRPPSRRSTSSGSRFDPMRATAAETASALRFRPASSTPVPRPTQSAASPP